jgi:hypothetical protein
MIWAKRFFLVVPFAIAAVLNVLSLIAHRLDFRPEQIAKYGFLFSAPWGRLVDDIWFGLLDRVWTGTRSHWLYVLLGYVTILWIPAILYSICVWVFFYVFKILSHRETKQSASD